MELNVLKDEITKGLRAFKAFENADAVLTELQTLEHVKKDTEARIAAAQKDLTAVGVEASKVNDVIAAGKAQADKIISNAESMAAGLIAEANEKSASIVAGIDKKCADKADELAAISQNVMTTRNELAILEDSKEKLQADVDALNKIKENARKFLG